VQITLQAGDGLQTPDGERVQARVIGCGQVTIRTI
jgi:hypothetical protein